jgi:HEAT repeat protein
VSSRGKKFRHVRDVLALLGGGDPRTLQGVAQAIQTVADNPDLFPVLVTAMDHENRVVCARASDAAEKISAKNPALLSSHAPALLNRLARSKHKEVRWHVAQMLARLPPSAKRLKRAVQVLERYLIDDSSIVKTCAMQSLYELASRNQHLRASVRLHITELSETGTPAMRARARKLLVLMQRNGFLNSRITKRPAGAKLRGRFTDVLSEES